jgi:hypothetical protein
MKKAVLTAMVVAVACLGLAGCCCAPGGMGGTGSLQPAFEDDTNMGRAMHYQNDLGPNDPRGPFDNWRRGGDPDRIAPRLPVNPDKPDYPTPVTPPAIPP